MTFNTKAEADAHDKMLDMVDELVPLLARMKPSAMSKHWKI